MSKKFLLKIMLAVTLSASALALASCASNVEITYSYGDYTASGSVKVKKGSEYALEVPEREGYTFEGWYASADFTGDPVESITVDGKVTFYAKWKPLPVITLDANGGTASKTTLYLAEGENVYDFLQDYKPTAPAGLRFGAWFDSKGELAENKKMPAEGLSLTAKYQVEYTVEVYLQNLALNGYEKGDSVTDYAYVDERNFSAVPEEKGFSLVSNAGEITSIDLSADASKNVLKYYFNRNSYTVTFEANDPEGVKREPRSQTVLYGEKIEAPYKDFARNGYVVVGWSTAKSGEIEFPAAYVQATAFNAEEKIEADSIEVTSDVTLYARWKQGYQDMFGGDDCIYLLDENSEEIYLCRGGVFFKGRYYPQDKEFSFKAANNKTMLEGKLLEAGTFSYSSDIRQNTASTLYKLGAGFDETQKIFFDGYNGLRYETYDANGISRDVSSGTYFVNEDGMLEVTFHSGEKSGQILTIAQSSRKNKDGVDTNAFQIRDNEEYYMSEALRGSFNGEAVVFNTENLQLTLDGVETAYFKVGEGQEVYRYKSEGEGADRLYTIMDEEYEEIFKIKIFRLRNQTVYMFYDEEYKGSYETTNGGVLTLDGVYNATIEEDGNKSEGYYGMVESVFGDTMIVYLFIGDDLRLFTLASSIDENDAVTYVCAEKVRGYSEYIYIDEKGLNFGPLLVVNNRVHGDAILYDYENGGYIEVSTGKWSLDEESGHLKYEAERYSSTGSASAYFIVSSYLFEVNEQDYNYFVHYWYSYETRMGGGESYEKTYTSEDGVVSITTVANKATVRYNTTTVDIAYDGGKDFCMSIANRYVRFTINGDVVSYDVYDYTPYTLTNGKDSLVFSGKGEQVSYTAGGVTTVGTVSALSADKFGNSLYEFTSDDKTFTYAVIGNTFRIYNATYGGEYTSDKGTLSLDGYLNKAELTENGVTKSGDYQWNEEGYVEFTAGDVFLKIRLEEDKYTVLGEEYGKYLFIENQSIEKNAHLDGAGKFTVSTLDEETLCFEGTYTVNDEEIVMSYQKGNETTTIYAYLGTYTIVGDGLYRAIIPYNETIVSAYVNEKDLTVLELDNKGNAFVYGKDGTLQQGYYAIISDELMYVWLLDDSDAFIYQYDKTLGTATQKKFKTRNYYTSDLSSSLLFTEYGFVRYTHGDASETYYYQTNDADTTASVYKRDPENAQANEYGFVMETFAFTEQKTYDGQTFYKGPDYAIVFERDSATKDDYRLIYADESYEYFLDLTFSPKGGKEFEIVGNIEVASSKSDESKKYPCYVEGETVNGKLVTYLVLITNYGYDRFDIELSFNGLNQDGTPKASYSVVGYSSYAEYMSYTYMEDYAKALYLYGVESALQVKNNVGWLIYESTYGKNGEISEEKYSFEFSDKIDFFGVDGNRLTVENAQMVDGEDGLFLLLTEAADGYTYGIYITLEPQQDFGKYGFTLELITRLEETTTPDGYVVETERVICSEYTPEELGGLQVGDLWTAFIRNGEEVTPLEKNGETLSYRETTVDETGKETLTLWNVELTLDENSACAVPVYASAERVRVQTVSVLYAANGADFVYLDEEKGEIVSVYFNSSPYNAKECTYEETTKEYSVTTALSEGSYKEYFTVVLDGQTVGSVVYHFVDLEYNPEDPESVDYSYTVVAIYAANGKDCVYFDQTDNRIVGVTFGGASIDTAGGGCEYDETTGIYSVKCADISAYEIKMVEGKPEITLVSCVLYDKDGNGVQYDFVEDTIIQVGYDGKFPFVTECFYTAETDIYTAICEDGSKFFVRIDKEKKTVEFIFS